MNGDLDLRRRYEEVREEEQRVAPPFGASLRRRPEPALRRWAPLAVAALLLIVIGTLAVFSMRSRREPFTAGDRIAARAIADWHPPTDFLLRTPGRELLTSTPSIPDRAARSLAQSSKGVSP
jgi:hypothetical protein